MIALDILNTLITIILNNPYESMIIFFILLIIGLYRISLSSINNKYL